MATMLQYLTDSAPLISSMDFGPTAAHKSDGRWHAAQTEGDWKAAHRGHSYCCSLIPTDILSPAYYSGFLLLHGLLVGSPC